MMGEMKKFLLKVIIPTIIVLLFLFVGLEIYLRSLPNDFKEKKQYLDLNAKSLKILVLGDSGAAMDVMPSVFDIQPSYNMAYHSQGIKYNYWILCEYLEEMDSLKYVLMNVGLGTLYGFDKNLAIQGRNKYYSIYYRYPGATEYEVLSPPLELIHRLFPSDNKQAVQTIDAFGYQGYYYEDIPYNEEEWIKSTAGSVELWEKTYQDDTHFDENSQILRDIVKRCEEKGVFVILFTTPSLKMFYNNINPAPKQKLLSLVRDLENDYENVMFIDYEKYDSIFPSNQMWYNATHLNRMGAEKFSLMLNDTINKLEMVNN